MIARRLFPLLALALASACNDGAAAGGGGIGLPTEPPPVADRQSSTCRAYAASLSDTRDALASRPGDPVLHERAAAFVAIMADACN